MYQNILHKLYFVNNSVKIAINAAVKNLRRIQRTMESIRGAAECLSGNIVQMSYNKKILFVILIKVQSLNCSKFKSGSSRLATLSQ